MDVSHMMWTRCGCLWWDARPAGGFMCSWNSEKWSLSQSNWLKWFDASRSFISPSHPTIVGEVSECRPTGKSRASPWFSFQPLHTQHEFKIDRTLMNLTQNDIICKDGDVAKQGLGGKGNPSGVQPSLEANPACYQQIRSNSYTGHRVHWQTA